MTGNVSGDTAAMLTAPIPIQTSRQGWLDMFGALRGRNFRLYTLSLFVGSTGGWMSRIAIDWLVLELTGNIALVGLVFTLQLAPTLLLGVWAGIISDRYRRRSILLVAQASGTAVMGVLAVFVFLGAAQLWLVFAVALISGVTMALDGPSRSAFASELVGVALLRNAISLNATTYNFSGLIGPALSGILIALIGTAWPIAISAATGIVAVVAISMIRSSELVRVPVQPRARGQAREAFRYLLRKPSIFWPMFLMVFAAVFAMAQPVLLAAAASDRGFASGSAGYGLYTTLACVGALAGSILAGRQQTLRLRGIVLWGAAFGLATALAGVVPLAPLFCAVLLGVGVSRLLFAIAAESMIQLSTNPGIRGRVLAFYILILTGGQAAGGALIGWVAEVFGVSAAFLIAGGVPALAAVGSALVLAHRQQLRIEVNLRSPRRIVRIVPRGRIGDLSPS